MIVGIDIGTQSLKAAVTDDSLGVRGEAQASSAREGVPAEVLHPVERILGEPPEPLCSLAPDRLDRYGIRRRTPA